MARTRTVTVRLPAEADRKARLLAAVLGVSKPAALARAIDELYARAVPAAMPEPGPGGPAPRGRERAT